MQTEVKKIYEEIEALEYAVSRLKARKETALDHIKQLQAKLPSKLMEYATGQCKEAEINQLHAEIQLLQQVANEPIKEAIRPLEMKNMELRSHKTLLQYRKEQKAKEEHQRYIDLFNKALEAKKLSAQDMVFFENIAPVHLKAEAREIIKQFKSYYRAKADRADARFEDFVTIKPTLI